MKILRYSITILLCISLCMFAAQAQTAPDNQREAQAANPMAQDVTITIQQEQVRFTAQKTIAEMQLQVFDPAGQLVYDSGAVSEAELKWVLRQGSGETVKSGLYAYTLSVKGAGAETARMRRGHFIVERVKERDGQTDRLWVAKLNDSAAGSESTAPTNGGVTIAGTGTASGFDNLNVAEGTTRNGEKGAKNKGGQLTPQAISGTIGQIAKFTSSADLGNSIITESNGRIGIGSASPTSKFHVVSGASDILPPRLQSSAIDTFAAGWDFYHGSTGVGYVGVPDAGAGVGPGEMLLYGVGKTSIWGGRQRSITIGANGNVGMGISDPGVAVRLNVLGPSDGTAVMSESSNGTGVLAFTNNGSALMGVANGSGYAGNFIGPVKLRGHLVPADYGMFDLGFPDTGRWRSLYVYSVHADNIIQTSDARMKKGVTNLRYGLRELMQLRPVSFEWKEKNDGQQHLGFIAQETEQIIPEAVTRATNPDTPIGMNYTTLIPVVIKAIQEQQATMTTLKNENEALQQRNTSLQQQNADLDTRLKALEQTIQQLMMATTGAGTRDQTSSVSSVSQGTASLQKQQRGPAQK
jgi:hypothetical protein